MSPLHHALGLREGSCFFNVVGGRHEKHFCSDIFGTQFAGFDFRSVFPPGGGFEQAKISDYQPFQV